MNFEFKIKKNKTFCSGYTIIETMIAVSLFIIIVMAGMGALLNANLLHNKSANMRSILDSLSFMVEDISRNMRVGKNYYCIESGDSRIKVDVPKSGPNCLGVAFETSIGDPANDNDQWVYYIRNGKLFKSTVGPYDTGANFTELNPDEVVLDTVSGFSVLGAEGLPGNSQQPLVVIRLSGKITLQNGVTTPFSLQTSVSQRLVDI